MNSIVRRLLPALMLCTAVSAFAVPLQAQDTNVRAAITVLDSTKEQDGLLGSVRRVKTETAKIELKDGRPVEGSPQLVEVTTYGIKGDRIENTSYPIKGGLVGKEEYKYDKRGNITEMTVRDDRGAIVSREAYDYVFDKFGNWTKMTTSLVLFENGELKREPIEVTYRTVTYYFDDTVAKLVEEPKYQPVQPVPTAPAVPEPTKQITDQQVLDPGASSTPVLSAQIAGEPPPAFIPIKSVESAVKVTTNNTDASGLFLAGRDFLAQHKDREAIKAFKESVKLNPNDAEAQYGLGFANFRIGRFRDAADAFKKAAVLEPRMAKAHYGLGLSYQELGMDKQLIEEYRILENLDRSLAKKLAQTFPQYNFSCRAVQGCP
ncbi:MAG TPA: tetratricopeptide repeat protein [Pyrinomonadaceae bacterium]|nr:tetratricopeptide repeat protein [Pyrinomonadaceae bacterium]